MAKLPPLNRQPNRLRPQSVNPRQGTVARRSSASTTLSFWQRHKIAIIIFALVGLAIALGLITYLLVTKYMVITATQSVRLVNVQPQVDDQQAVSNLLDSYKGRSLVLLNQQDVANKITQTFPAIKTVEIIKHYPQSLEVRYIPTVPFCQIHTPQGDFLVNRDGRIFAKRSAPQLPTIYSPQSDIRVGSTITADSLNLSLALIQGLKGLDPKLQSITMGQNQLEVALASDPRILVGLDQSAPSVIVVIRSLMAQFKDQKHFPRQLDLRFDRPVIIN